MALIVQKFGGTSVADAQKIHRAAKRAIAAKETGHEVVVACQDPAPERFDLGGAQVVRPQLDTRLPVFVVDRYEGLEPVLLQEMPLDERERYVALNAAALKELLPADLVFANHVLMGAPVAAATGARFGVKAHGSELEYSMRGNVELEAWGAASLRNAHAVFVGPRVTEAGEPSRGDLDLLLGHGRAIGGHRRMALELAPG